MSLRPLALAAALAAAPALAASGSAATPRAEPSAATQPGGGAVAARPPAASAGGTTVTGKVAAVDPARGTVTIESAAGRIALQVDRNTGVFLEDRMGTLRHLAPGAPVRACYAEADRTAFWIEVQPATMQPARTAQETARPSPPGPSTPPAAGAKEGAVPPAAGATGQPGSGPEQPGSGRTTPAPKSGG